MNTNKFSTRKIKYYIPDVFTNEKPSKLELSVFTLKDGSHIDIGAMCYRQFKPSYNSKNTSSDYVKQTDINSLDKRRDKFLSNLIDSIRLQDTIKSSSKRNGILKIMKFIHWIGLQDFDCDFQNEINVKTAYQEYTKWLFHRIKMKDGEKLKLKNNTAQQEQSAARLACSLMTDVSVKTIEYWATPIRFSDRDSFNETLTNNPTTDEDKIKTYAALCDFIHQTWSLWIKKTQSSITINGNQLYDHLDLYNEIKREEIYNKAVVAALLSFIGASGSNLQVALAANLDNFDYGQTQKNTRLSGIKSRAKGKTVYPEFAAKYLNIWKKWLDVRTAWIKSHNTGSDLAFPYLGEGDSIKTLPSSLTDKTKTAAKLFTKNYGVTWFTARDWRGFKSKLIGQVSGNDIFISADMQDHTIKTAIRHYTNRNLSDAAKEISTALNAVYESAIARSRHKDKIEVRIIEIHDPNHDTSIGGCMSEASLTPVIADGFTVHAPQPDCSVKETCVFCDKYAAHADEIDIRKLLSFKFLANELNKTMPQAEWASRWSPYIHRVDEILNEMKSTNPDTFNIIKKISEEIELGELDEFWLDYYETLSHLGVVLS